MTIVAGAGPVAAPQLPAWLPYVGAGVGLSGVGAGAVWLSGHIAPDRAVHDGALFVHLACLVLGFGAVLAVDWSALLWMAGRADLHDVVRLAGTLHVPIWTGFVGLVLSGVFLEPNLSSPLTQAKLALVLVILWNGVLATWQHARLTANPANFRFGLAAATAAISQVGWWGGMTIGFLNAC